MGDLVVKLRRFSSEDVEGVAAVLEQAFKSLSSKKVFRRESRDGVAVNLDQGWRLVNSAVASGDQFPVTGPASLIAISGAMVATFETPRDAILLLTKQEVSEARRFLDGLDFEELVDQDSRRDVAAGGYPHPEWLKQEIVGHLEALRRLFFLAVESGDLVAKRVYAHYSA
ncbi:DUF1877 family protein [Nocardioides sp. CCNWLW239]|uniref:DUF1877 family protein n=1 Tax=Nocardioides sp. CCNWLW239 TaxID=3128902 RepID=UPI0030159638